jgi:hypothetical protein
LAILARTPSSGSPISLNDNVIIISGNAVVFVSIIEGVVVLFAFFSIFGLDELILNFDPVSNAAFHYSLNQLKLFSRCPIFHQEREGQVIINVVRMVSSMEWGCIWVGSAMSETVKAE